MDRKYGAGAAAWKRGKLAKQGDVCARCGTDDPGKKGWCFDHDQHVSPSAGLVCDHCNTLLGWHDEGYDVMAFARSLVDNPPDV